MLGVDDFISEINKFKIVVLLNTQFFHFQIKETFVPFLEISNVFKDGGMGASSP